jgi:vacuolar-type H+-ATPase subunit D/Vma8
MKGLTAAAKAAYDNIVNLERQAMADLSNAKRDLEKESVVLKTLKTRQEAIQEEYHTLLRRSEELQSQCEPSQTRIQKLTHLRSGLLDAIQKAIDIHTAELS